MLRAIVLLTATVLLAGACAPDAAPVRVVTPASHPPATSAIGNEEQTVEPAVTLPSPVPPTMTREAVQPAPPPPSTNTPVPPPPPPPARAGYPCEASDCNCADFPTHAEAQRVYDAHGGHNWSGLDRDGDGSVCESLP